jgi:hypothetical protein
VKNTGVSEVFHKQSSAAAFITELLALTDAPDNALVDQVVAIGERAVQHMLSDAAARLHHADQQTVLDCSALINRIDALIRPA